MAAQDLRTQSLPTADLPADLHQFFFDRLNFEKAAGFRYDDRSFAHRPLRELLQVLQNPHELPVVHIAGTKGKGSVASLVQKAVAEAGYKTGLYTSPHLFCLTERFVVDHAPITFSQLREAIDEMLPAVQQVDQRSNEDAEFGRLTFFDLCTAAAFVAFRQQAVQLAAIEVGMGGRLDSTNVVSPLVSVITTISFDHTEQLGNTLAKIAGEKAGIIKPGAPVVSGVRAAEAADVIRETAERQHSPLWQLGRDFQWSSQGEQTVDPWTASFAVHFGDSKGKYFPDLDGLRIAMPGSHQRDNAAVAVQALRCLQQSDWQISDDQIRTAFARTVVPGRIQQIQQKPTIVLDAAHNPASFSALTDTLKSLQLPGGRKRLVFAVSSDKDYRNLLAQAAAYFDEVIFCKYVNNPRGVEPRELAECWDQVTGELRVQDRSCQPTPMAAFLLGKQRSSVDDLLVVAGSVFLLAELEDCRPNPPV